MLHSVAHCLNQYACAIAQGELVSFSNPFASGYHAPGLAIYGKSVQDGVPTPAAPVEIQSVSGGSWHRTGRNLLPDNVAYDTQSSAVVRYARSGGIYHGIANLAYTNTSRDLKLGRAGGVSYQRAIPTLPNTDHTFGVAVTGNAGEITHMYAAGVNKNNVITGLTAYRDTFALSFNTRNFDRVSLIVYPWGYNTRKGTEEVDIYPQLELGSVATPFQPYQGQVIDLAGLDMGGVGQVCDSLEWDGADWRHYQRTAEIASYNGESIPGAYISSTGGLDTGATVRYVLAAPIVSSIDLPAPVIIPGENNMWVSGSGVVPELEVKYLVHS